MCYGSYSQVSQGDEKTASWRSRSTSRQQDVITPHRKVSWQASRMCHTGVACGSDNIPSPQKGLSSRPAPSQHARLNHALTIRITAPDLMPLVRATGESMSNKRIHAQRPDHKAGPNERIYASGESTPNGQ